MANYTYQDSEYKKRLRNEVLEKTITVAEQREKAVEARKTFLSKSEPIAERLEAAKLMGNFTEPADIKKAVAIFKDESQPENIRSYAFSSVSGLVLSDESLMQDAIDALKAGEGEGQIALSALRILQLAEISSPDIMERHTAAFKDALRTVVDHSNKNLRAIALEILAMEKDEYAQRRLLESLEKQDDDLIEPEVAIQLLAYDLHANYYPVMRQIAQYPPNQIAKREALRNLGTDVESKDLLVETLINPDEDPEIRHAAVTALISQAPELAVEYSKEIIINEKGEHLDELKTALLNTMVYTEKRAAERPEKMFNESLGANNFTAQLQSLKSTSGSEEFKEMIDFYINNSR